MSVQLCLSSLKQLIDFDEIWYWRTTLKLFSKFGFSVNEVQL
jgi:hypothetical protein